ncbi:MAG: hypothetical protein Q9160_004323 [Pyrenula sp. 1 TL-2023]
MARLSCSVINLLSYLLVALLFLKTPAAPSKPDSFSDRQILHISPRGQSPSTNVASQPKGNRPPPAGAQRNWNPATKNKKEREGFQDVGDNSVSFDPSEVPMAKESKMKKDPDDGNGPDACNGPAPASAATRARRVPFARNRATPMWTGSAGL